VSTWSRDIVKSGYVAATYAARKFRAHDAGLRIAWVIVAIGDFRTFFDTLEIVGESAHPRQRRSRNGCTRGTEW